MVAHIPGTRGYRRRVQFGNVQALLEVQLTASSVVVQPIRDIGILLDLTKSDAAADRVHCARFREKVSPGLTGTQFRCLHGLRSDGLADGVLRLRFAKSQGDRGIGSTPRRMCHISVLPREFSAVRAYASSGCT